MKINQLKAGAMLSYATQGINILSGLIYTPVMLRILGQSEYGLYQLVYSLVSHLSLLSFGFASSYMRFYSRYKADEDENRIASLNGMFFTIFAVLTLLCIVCGMAMVVGADLIFGDKLSAAELSKAKILMSVMVVNMGITFMTTVFTNQLLAHERFFFQRILGFFKALFNPFLTLPLLLLGYGSIGMVAVTTLLSFSDLILEIWYSKKRIKTKFSFKGFDFSLLKEMWAFTAFIFINMIVDQINWSIDKFLLGRFMGTNSVAVYSVAAQLNSMYLVLAGSLSAVFIPRVNMIVAKSNDNNQLTELLVKVGRIQFMILGLVISGFVFFGKAFIAVWAGEGYEHSYVIALLLMLPVTVPMLQNLGVEIQRAKNRHKARSLMYLCVAVFNLIISILLIGRFGAVGAAMGTAIAMILGNGFFMNWYYHYRLRLDMKCFWRGILKFIPAMILPVAAGVGLSSFSNSLSALVGGIITYTAVYAVSMLFIGMNKEEKALLTNKSKSGII